MWVFTNNAFFSVVKDRDNANGVVVRARVPGDLEKVFGSVHKVHETENSDYRFRMYLDHEYVTEVISEEVSNIDYDNFKNSIPKEDKERYSYYTRVWSVMNSWQESMYPYNPDMYGIRNWYKTNYKNFGTYK